MRGEGKGRGATGRGCRCLGRGPSATLLPDPVDAGIVRRAERAPPAAQPKPRRRPRSSPPGTPPPASAGGRRPPGSSPAHAPHSRLFRARAPPILLPPPRLSRPAAPAPSRPEVPRPCGEGWPAGGLTPLWRAAGRRGEGAAAAAAGGGPGRPCSERASERARRELGLATEGRPGAEGGPGAAAASAADSGLRNAPSEGGRAGRKRARHSRPDGTHSPRPPPRRADGTGQEAAEPPSVQRARSGVVGQPGGARGQPPRGGPAAAQASAPLPIRARPLPGNSGLPSPRHGPGPEPFPAQARGPPPCSSLRPGSPRKSRRAGSDLACPGPCQDGPREQPQPLPTRPAQPALPSSQRRRWRGAAVAHSRDNLSQAPACPPPERPPAATPAGRFSPRGRAKQGPKPSEILSPPSPAGDLQLESRRWSPRCRLPAPSGPSSCPSSSSSSSPMLRPTSGGLPGCPPAPPPPAQAGLRRKGPGCPGQGGRGLECPFVAAPGTHRGPLKSTRMRPLRTASAAL